MRTLELLKSLSKKDLKQVEALVLANKRKTLVPLFKELKRPRLQTQLPDRAELFKKTFGKPYTKTADYLLRNELRLLNEIIYDYLITSSFKEHLNKYPAAYYQWLLNGFFFRKMNLLFEADIDKAIAQSITDQMPEETAIMLDRKSLWLMQTQPRTIENLNHQLDVTRQWKKEEERRLLFRIREAEAREAFIEMVRNSIENKLKQKADDSRTPGQTVFDLTRLENDGWKAQYLLLKKHSSETKNEVRIGILNQMLKVEEAPYFKSDFSFNAQVVTLTNLALEHILLNKFEDADRFMRECIKRCENKKVEIPIANLQNYIAVQVVIGTFEKGLEVYKKYEDNIVNSRSAANIAVLACFCHIFLKQPEQALALIPPSAKMTPDNLVVSRLIYAIVFFMRGNYELALTECNNLKRASALGSVEKKNDIYASVTLWSSKYFAAFTKAIPERQKEINALAKIMKTNRNLIYPHLKKEFALLWLVTEVMGENAVRNKRGVICFEEK